jgi:hypothetical protein
MSKARHGFMDGGKPSINQGRESETEDKMEAGHNKGGKVKRAKGGRTDAFAAGGAPKMRMDRPGRKRGGGVGADRTPLSSAANTSDASGHTGGEGKCG